MSAVVTYAVGDIHGSFTQLRNLLNHCTTHRGERSFRMVFLGDYVDRGPRSDQVIDTLIEKPLPGFEHVHLVGNHEESMLRFLSDVPRRLCGSP